MTKEAVVIERTFDVAIELIWQMWTDPNISNNGTGHKASPYPWPRWMCAWAEAPDLHGLA